MNTNMNIELSKIARSIAERPDSDLISLHYVKTGGLFLYNDTLYIKTDEADTDNCYLVVDLSNGFIESINENEDVLVNEGL